MTRLSKSTGPLRNHSTPRSLGMGYLLAYILEWRLSMPKPGPKFRIEDSGRRICDIQPALGWVCQLGWLRRHKTGCAFLASQILGTTA